MIVKDHLNFTIPSYFCYLKTDDIKKQYFTNASSVYWLKI